MTDPNGPGASASAPDGERLRDLLDRLPQTVFEADLEGRLTYANRSAFAAFGYSPEMRRGLTVLDLVVPEQREQARETSDAVSQRAPTRFTNTPP